jgi:hypothetical protein
VAAYDYQRCEYCQHHNYSGYVHHLLLLVGVCYDYIMSH